MIEQIKYWLLTNKKIALIGAVAVVGFFAYKFVSKKLKYKRIKR